MHLCKERSPLEDDMIFFWVFLLTRVALGEEIVVWNKYTQRLGPIGEDYPWRGSSVIIDAQGPWYAQSLRPDERWELLNESGSSVSVQWGSRFECQGVAEGAYTLVSKNLSKSIYAMFVRRELRDLDDDDRERLLRAMSVIYQTSTFEGRRIYGSAFTGLDAVVTLHQESAAQRDADHIHQGSGFLAQHAKLSKIFEDSLRSVDPKVSALPYWDSTIEMSHIDLGLSSSVFENNVLWTDKWFGHIGAFVEHDLEDLSDAKWAIQDGTFAFLKAMRPEDAYRGARGLYFADDGSFLPRNAYGYLRAPWNNNPSPYVVRYPKKQARLPNCETHRFFGESDRNKNKESWTSRSLWMYDVSNEAHGPMHSGPGGMVSPLLETEGETLEKFGIFNVKQHTLWRFHVLEFPKNCSSSLIDCGPPKCNRALWNFNMTAIGYEIVKAQVHVPSDSDLNSWRSKPQELANMAEAYCSNPPDLLISGDAKDSGGSIEPSFWFIHPAITRLYQYRLLFGPPFTDNSWPLNNACFGARSSDIDPDRLAFSESLASTEKNVLGVSTAPFFEPPTLKACGFETCCNGHFATSRLYARYPDIPVGLTNDNILELMDPTTGPNFKYPVYHHFTWNHCDKIGVPFRNTTLPLLRRDKATTKTATL